MVAHIFWTSLALKDLSDIREYIQKDNPRAGRQEAGKIKSSVERLKSFPLSGRPSPDILGVREVVKNPYRIFYRVRSKNIEILRIYHEKRNLTGIAL